VSDKAQVAGLWEKVPQEFRDVDVLGNIFWPFHQSHLPMARSPVNNAGYVVGREHVGDIIDADIEGMFATNVFGLISMTQLLVKGNNLDCKLVGKLTYPR
jgi:3-hydroxy acid dehydrogenase / malonic semialdehyde reductase